MPTYEYVCQSCGKRFEAWQKITDDPISTCPNCSGAVHRVIYPVGLMFKGSGFYTTDNRGASSAATSPDTHTTPASDANGSASKSSGGSEAKSEASSTAGSAKTANGE